MGLRDMSTGKKWFVLAIMAALMVTGCGSGDTPSGGRAVPDIPTCDFNCTSSSGACSGHGGVNCAAGPDTDGSVICTDGWLGSSVTYSCF
ncbi:hypothetical protein LCGC14_3055410 [marine sediment metagenome]|uniref:Lipoprotein n=1 Tax=marine sediment metagenome TaxID=412755 RepID=A0A0F8X8Q8_9ZZZZ